MRNICYESTRSCNLNCDYCISSDNNCAKGEIRDYHEIIDFFAELKPERIVISGGEPLIDELLVQKLEYINKKCSEAFISLSTNGTIDFDYKRLEGLVHCVDFSLPAINGDIYQNMRGRNMVSEVTRNIANFRSTRIKKRLSYTLTRINKGELASILDRAEEWGIDEVRIGRFFPFRNAAALSEKYEISDAEIESIMGDINMNKYSYRIVPPIKKLELMENGYLTINFCGEIFLPTRIGKKVIGFVDTVSCADVENISTTQNDVFKSTNMQKRKHYFDIILKPFRLRDTTSSYTRNAIEEYYSDHSRIIYSQAFRRLQQKAQVFSLETNSSVRSRLSHSIEVADVGRLIARRVVTELNKRSVDDIYYVSDECGEMIVSIVENACLLHDIGNPPFGHFGEAAIQTWWKEKYKYYLKEYNKRAKKSKQASIAFSTVNQLKYLADFEQFDGNPQGLRTMLRLRKGEVISPQASEKDEDSQYNESGMNLTYQTVLSCLKYVIAAGDEKPDIVPEGLAKKAGYFQSESLLIEEMCSRVGLMEYSRFPLVYIMEAADDISYCMSDVADSIEKKLTTLEQFIERLDIIWQGMYCEKIPEEIISEKKRKAIKEGKLKDFNMGLVTEWAGRLIRKAADIIVNNIDSYCNGKEEAVIDKSKNDFKLLKAIATYSRQYIYNAAEAEEIEIAGYAIISGLLDCFGQLLILTKEEFEFVLNGQNNPKKRHLEVEARLCHLIGDKYIDSYRNQLLEWEHVNKDKRVLNEYQLEWWLRVHLVIDQIAGMTDEYALKSYQLCKGIDVRIV